MTQPNVQQQIKVSISPDGLKAFLTIQPSNEHGELTDVKEILEKLWQNRVTTGIKNQLIIEILKHRIYNKSILIAEGIPPQDGQNATIDYNFKKKKKPELMEDFEGRVDFRELGLIDIVKKGDVLAFKIPPTPGIPGKKVTGEEIKAKDGEDINIPIGRNTQLSPDKITLIAAENGYVVWENDKLNVETTYSINGDVDMKTGNIYFVGPVKIKGDVKEGFSVRAEGNIDVWGGVDNAILWASGDILVYGGIRKGQVYTEGNVNCRFIENARVEAKGNITVSDAILHSEITSGKSIFVLEGRKGAIMGGRIKAKEEIHAKNIGSMSEVPTLIEVGSDPTLREEMDRLEESLQREMEELQQVKLNYNSLMAQQKTELAREYLNKKVELENSIKMMTTHLHQIRSRVSGTKEGMVSVYETLWPGVKITIGLVTFEPKIDYRYLSFVNKLGRIESQAYQGPKIKIEMPAKKVGYWEREIDKVKNGKG